MYKEFQIILFGIEVQIFDAVRVFLNPNEYIFQECMHYGFILADSLVDVDIINNYKFPESIVRGNHFI